MKAYIGYGSIVFIITSLILTGYQMVCGAVLSIFCNDNRTTPLCLLRGGLAALILLPLFYQKELRQLYPKHKTNTPGSLEQALAQKRAFLLDTNAAVKNFIARVLTLVERFSFSL